MYACALIRFANPLSFEQVLGELDAATLVLQPKSFVRRWVLGVGFALLLHPGWRWAAEIFVAVVDRVGSLRFLGFCCLWARYQWVVRRYGQTRAQICNMINRARIWVAFQKGGGSPLDNHPAWAHPPRKLTSSLRSLGEPASAADYFALPRQRTRLLPPPDNHPACPPPQQKVTSSLRSLSEPASAAEYFALRRQRTRFFALRSRRSRRSR
jgi:hypothetical protein